MAGYITKAILCPKTKNFSADLVSSTCQLCGESFSRATQLSLHYREKHSEEIGKEADSNTNCHKNSGDDFKK
jgi:hypothetical protein